MPFNFNLAADGSRHAISIRGKNIVATRTTDNILSLAVLLKTGYKVKFRVFTVLDPTDGSDLYMPKGKRIARFLRQSLEASNVELTPTI